MLKKFFISCLFLFFILIFLCTTTCYATAVTVTKEKLNEVFQRFVSSEANEGNYDVSVSNNVINVTAGDEVYTLNYSLGDKMNFSFEVPIQEGMSYEDFQKGTEGLILPMLGYIAVANIQGVGLEDASSYLLFSYLAGALNGSFPSENTYTIIDDLNLSEGVTIEKTDDPKTIYTSEFGNRVMEYVNTMYKEKQTITDSTGINSYLLTIEKQSTTETSCKLVSTLSIDSDADFSKLIGYANQEDESPTEDGTTAEEGEENASSTDDDAKNEEKKETLTATVNYNITTNTTGKVVATIKANKQINEVKGWTLSKDKKTLTKTYSANTTETINLVDIDGMTKEVEIKVTNIIQKDIENKDNTTVDGVLPQTGATNTILISFIAIVIVSIVIYKKYSNYKDIK